MLLRWNVICNVRTLKQDIYLMAGSGRQQIFPNEGIGKILAWNYNLTNLRGVSLNI